MNWFTSLFLIFQFLLFLPLHGDKIQSLYTTLKPGSVLQHLAFYELYPNTQQGSQALQHALKLLVGDKISDQEFTQLSLQNRSIEALVSLVTKPADGTRLILSDSELRLIERIAQHLPNRKLKGYKAQTEQDLQSLTPEQIDLSRGLLISQYAGEENALPAIRSYDALIDLMALQILVNVSMEASPEEKIREINRYIFEEMGFRFPPHSLYAKDIDLYTFLPSVLDSRHGVCLGVCILYISLAQRLDLSLEMITPPGHIYVRYRKGDHIVNIETTARGINLETEQYLGVNTRKLQQRNIKEVIGLAHYNQGSGYLQVKEYEKAYAAYQKAKLYLPEDAGLKELIGFAALFLNKKEEGRLLLKESMNQQSEFQVKEDNIVEDYLSGRVSIEGIQALFLYVDETRESILKKKEEMEKILQEYPLYRSGWFHLAVAWLQLHRAGEALKVLQHYHELDSTDPTAEYYLAILEMSRYHPNKAWEYFRNAEKIVNEKNHHPKAIKELRKHLSLSYPE